MTESQTLEALAAIGLRGEARSTGHPDYRRIFIIDAGGILQGRITMLRGQYDHATWYVDHATGERVLPDERLPWAWRVWITRREQLDIARWNVLVQRAEQLARADRSAKQAWRAAHPKRGKRQRLTLNTRRHLAMLLNGGA